ncbi:MAG: hypothetical protein LBR68_03555 [Lachnoclostridium sp.]|nr:hypothetical protein [Lachnoclostridium sp.]
MQEIIEKLAEIEKKANHVIDNSISGKVEVERRKKAELAELEETLTKESEKKLEQLRSSLEKETQPEIDSVYKEGYDHLNKIETSFYLDREKIVNEVFHRITS